MKVECVVMKVRRVDPERGKASGFPMSIWEACKGAEVCLCFDPVVLLYGVLAIALVVGLSVPGSTREPNGLSPEIDQGDKGIVAYD